MSTVEKVKLKNGVTLGERMESKSGYSLSKDKARKAFSGKVDEIACDCMICYDTSDAHTDDFGVECGNDGSISIGCVDFDEEQVAQVKKWLGE